MTSLSVEQLEQLKAEGSAYLKEGNYKEALRKYHTAHLHTRAAMSSKQTASSFSHFKPKTTEPVDEEEEKRKDEEITKLHVALLGNMALCHLKLKKFGRVVSLCTEVLTTDNDNIKALWRRAKANIELKRLNSAMEDVKKGLELDPENKDMQQLKTKLSKLDKEYQQKGDKFLSGNLQKMWG
eukprot:m.123528 g.123528  ORF g.123528 m.123528 type:complete len:182 (-) comp12949_c1_seq1:47-592(-)